MRPFPACLLAALLLGACSPGTVETVPAPGAPRPYRTGTPPATASVVPLETEAVLPTPTPLVHTVVEGDTLFGIAGRYGISYDLLLAANPGVQANALSVGTRLVIPTGDTPAGEPTPTPAGVALRQARCWPEAGGGLWCFALYENTYAEAVENLAVQFVLLDEAGRTVDSQVGYGLLNRLPSGAAMPLAVHFPAPASPPAGLGVQLLTSIRLLPGDTRYLPAEVATSLVRLGPGGRTASLEGRVVLEGETPAGTVWVLAVAYDSDGRVIGVRRWESPAAGEAGQPLPFAFEIASLGPPIARVDFLAEARP